MGHELQIKEHIIAQLYGNSNALLEALEAKKISMEDKIEIASQMATIQAGLKALKSAMNKSIEVEDV